MKSLAKKLSTVLMLLIAVLVFSMLHVSAAVVSEPQEYITNDDNIQIETKFKKTSNIKVIWNGNGGKIGSKKTVSTNIRKGEKIKKLATTPKRVGYTFKGWYTQKTGGKKITKDTKPSKSVTYFAQWTKKLTTEEKKLSGLYIKGTLGTGFWLDTGSYYSEWRDYSSFLYAENFKPDGTYEAASYASKSSYVPRGKWIFSTGNWHIHTKGTVSITNYVEDVRYDNGEKKLNQFPGRHWDYNYVFQEKDGKKGIEYGNSAFDSFYEKYDKP